MTDNNKHNKPGSMPGNGEVTTEDTNREYVKREHGKQDVPGEPVGNPLDKANPHPEEDTDEDEDLDEVE